VQFKERLPVVFLALRFVSVLMFFKQIDVNRF